MPPKTNKPTTVFGAALCAERERLGITMEEAAALFPGYAGGEAMARRTWQDWENGLRTPPAWCQALVIRALARKKTGIAARGRMTKR